MVHPAAAVKESLPLTEWQVHIRGQVEAVPRVEQRNRPVRFNIAGILDLGKTPVELVLLVVGGIGAGVDGLRIGIVEPDTDPLGEAPFERRRAGMIDREVVGDAQHLNVADGRPGAHQILKSHVPEHTPGIHAPVGIRNGLRRVDSLVQSVCEFDWIGSVDVVFHGRQMSALLPHVAD